MNDIRKELEGFSPEQRELLELLLSEEGVDTAHLPILARERDGAPPPLSFAQQRMWFLNQLEPASVAYNVSFAARLTGRLDVAALRRSLTEVVRRHEALRTTFAEADGEPVQVIREAAEASLHVVDLGALPEGEREQEARRQAAEEARRPFDLVAGPMLRTTLYRLGEREHAVLLVTHHIVSDAWSTGVFMRELATLYEAYTRGEPSPLAELPIQYADFAVWQRQRLRGAELAGHLDYWRETLAAMPPALELPTDWVRPPVNTYRGANHSLVLGAELTERLKRLSNAEGATLFMTLLSAYVALLYRHTGQADIAVGTPIAARNRAEVEDLIGFFANTLVMRARLGRGMTFRELLAHVREVTLGAYTHQELPFEMLVDELQPERDLSRNLLFQVWFVLQNTPAEGMKLSGLSLSEMPFESGTAKFDLALTMLETRDGLVAEFNYNRDLFASETVARMAGHFGRILEEAAADPERKLERLSLLSDAERRLLVEDRNETRARYERATPVHELFERQAARTPEAAALRFGEEWLTYAELNRRANRLAHHLRRLGVGPESRVGICVERSLEMVVGLLAVMKAGGAYVPLDPTYPAERVLRVLESAGARVLLTKRETAAKLPDGYEGRVVCFDADRAAIEEQSADDPRVPVAPENLAYVIYTSGSTGTPKGVCVTHGGLTNYTQFIRAKLRTGGADDGDGGERNVGLHFALVSTFTADLGNTCLFPSLVSGGCLHVVDYALATDCARLAAYTARHPFDVLKITPSHLGALLASPQGGEVLPREFLLLGGEALPFELVNRVAELRPGCAVINHYGPTETTVGCLTLDVAETETVAGRARTVPVGRPIANTRAFILDANLELVPPGSAGELCIGGDGLARGYLNEPRGTAERFVPDSLSGEPGARLYRTGDLARFHADGQIEFLGRVDHQVKIRGFRIELGEIEATLAEHPAVREVVVTAPSEGAGERRLVAYVVARDGARVSAAELREFLGRKLPEYMIPQAFVVLDALPLTPNGKIDRRALPTPDEAQARGGRSVALPRDNLEIQLAQIWKDVLGLETQPGITDNFFELGGHSISAVRLMAQVSKWFGQKLPLSALFESATVERLAEVLRGRAESAAPSPLVRIQPARPRGSRPPFVCVHTGSGEVIAYEPWARHLGAEQPFYALQDHAAYTGRGEGRGVEQIAAHYVAAVREAQPAGPYYLGGWSFGGLVAFEMAQQLKRAGESVGLLVLVDAIAPAFRGQVIDSDAATLLTVLANQLTRSTMTAEELLRLVAELRELEGEAQLRHVVKYFAETRGEGEGFDTTYALEYLRRQLNVFRSRVEASLAYRPERYDGRVTLFRPLEEPEDMKTLDQTKGWGDLATGGVEIHRVPGNHQTMGLEPNVSALAAELKACLERAQGEASAASGD
ncbi:MAG TPA: amino acid adenylation domain-containing protein [Pyrinomonadaceae bacterium]|nr:amino acid adenylation domain-containing protein [Pyrinomonadaceae bacterium]